MEKKHYSAPSVKRHFLFLVIYLNINTAILDKNLSNVSSVNTFIASPQLQQYVQMREAGAIQPSASQATSTSNNKGKTQISTEELGSLVSTLDHLFVDSDQWDQTALLFLMEGLYELNMRTVLEVDPDNIPSRPFALAKLEEVVMNNLQRAEIYWDQLLDHFKTVCRHNHPTVRLVGVEVFSRVVIAIFSFFSHPERSSDTLPENEDELTVETRIYIQNRLLEALEEASRSMYPEIRQKTLETLNQVLQSSGQTITKGWPLILSILMTIAVNHDKPHIVYGFNSVTLICTDFLSNLPLGMYNPLRDLLC